ncbi:MAG: FAD-binding protein [Acidimicrobiales bacterium]
MTDTPPELDLLVLGSGVAGLSAAVRAAAVAGLRVGVLTKAELHQSATRWAQGGVAAVLSGDEDSTDVHFADTVAAGVGLCDADAVRVLVDEGPSSVHELIALGAVFDTDRDGALALAREGGHSHARVVHAGGAATGAEIERALVAAVQETAAAVLEGWFALDLLVEGDRCRGVVALDPVGQAVEVRSRHVLMATGGAGQLFAVTTNPTQSTGDGLAMALRAGVAVADIEFMQFHPTALHHPATPRPLLSEALRGHGAVLRDAAGDRFVDELLPRDQVSRAMTTRMLDQGVDHLWLDATGLDGFHQRYPTIAASMRDVGLDPSSDWLPIAPAAHYLSGGAVTDLDGATSLPGLWACGEAACTGVHGANRLASNSLLEGLVFAPRAVAAVIDDREGPRPTGAMRSVLDGAAAAIGGRPLAWTPPAWAGSAPAASDAAKLRDEVQRAMTLDAGVVRSGASLAAAARALAAHGATTAAAIATKPGSAHLHEVANLVTCGLALAAAADARTESRGNHWRRDHPGTDDAQRHRLVIARP